MTQVTISVVLGPRQSRPSSREKPSVPWEAPSRAISAPNRPHTMNTHWWLWSVVTRKKASIQPMGKESPSTMI